MTDVTPEGLSKPQTTDGEQLVEQLGNLQIEFKHSHNPKTLAMDGPPIKRNLVSLPSYSASLPVIAAFIQERDQQRLAAVLEMAKGLKTNIRYESRDGGDMVSVERAMDQVDYFVAAITATLAPDTTNGVEEK